MQAEADNPDLADPSLSQKAGTRFHRGTGSDDVVDQPDQGQTVQCLRLARKGVGRLGVCLSVFPAERLLAGRGTATQSSPNRVSRQPREFAAQRVDRIPPPLAQVTGVRGHGHQRTRGIEAGVRQPSPEQR